MNVGMGLRIMLIMITINFFLYLSGGVAGGFGIDTDYMADDLFINYDRDNPNGNLTADTSETYGLNESVSGSSTSGFFGTFDVWGKVSGVVDTINHFLFAPYHVLSATSMPSVVCYLIAVIWTTMYVVAIAQFIWRGVI